MIKFLSRKVILSWLIMIIATLFLIQNKLGESEFGMILGSIVAIYTIGRTIDKKYAFQIDRNNTWIDVWHRIKSMFSREFVFTVLSVIGLTYLTEYDYISGDLWFKTVIVIGNSYNIFNSLEKI